MASTPHTVHQTSASAHRFALLDLLRGIAAILVAVFHAPTYLGRWVPARQGYLAVDLFFVLSGFVVAYAYQHRLMHGLRIRDFVAARLIRLYPLFLLGSLFGFTVVVFLIQSSPLQYGGSLLLRQVTATVLFLPYSGSVSPVTNSRLLFPYDVPCWSLACELVANVAFAMLVRRAASWIFAAIAAGSFIAMIMLALPAGNLGGGSDVPTMAIGYARAGYSFFIGVLTYRLFVRGRVRPFGKAASRRMAWGICILAVLALSTPLTRPLIMQTLTVAVFFPAIIYFGALTQLSTTWHKAAAFLGDISYPFYLLHYPVMYLLAIPGAQEHLAPYRRIVAPLLMLGTIAASWLAMRFYDAPIRKRLARYYNAHFTLRANHHPLAAPVGPTSRGKTAEAERDVA